METFIYGILKWLLSLGYFGVALGLMIEIIPSEIVLAYGGFLISKGEINFWGAIAAGTFGGVMAQLFLYWLGYYGGRPILLKYGKYLFISNKQIDLSESWFEKFGPGVIFTARFIPVIRHAISIPAGISKMSHVKFLIYTTLAIIPWSAFFIYLGMKLGANWKMIHAIAAPYIQPLIVVMSFVFVFYILYSLRKGRK